MGGKFYNKCTDVGRFPDVWKTAEVVIIQKHKDKDAQEPKSYRPICLLDVLGKIL